MAVTIVAPARGNSTEISTTLTKPAFQGASITKSSRWRAKPCWPDGLRIHHITPPVTDTTMNAKQNKAFKSLLIILISPCAEILTANVPGDKVIILPGHFTKDTTWILVEVRGTIWVGSGGYRRPSFAVTVNTSLRTWEIHLVLREAKSLVLSQWHHQWQATHRQNMDRVVITHLRMIARFGRLFHMMNVFCWLILRQRQWCLFQIPWQFFFWAMVSADACVLSDSGISSHIWAGKVLHAWTSLPPQKPVHAKPDRIKSSRIRDSATDVRMQITHQYAWARMTPALKKPGAARVVSWQP